jgi:TonB-linked SusC/RagA family outer membrane protein
MSKRELRWRYLLPLATILWSGFAAAQGPARGGTITGSVIDSTSQTPIAGAEVFVVPAGGGAARHGTRTAANGRYALTGVPAGTVTLRVRLVGYQPKDQSVAIVDGQTVGANFAIMPRSTQLEGIVVTGTAGATQKRAIGNVVESINGDEVMQVAPARNVEQLVGSRAPGVIVMPASGQVGTGAQIRIRGASSLSLSNDPIIYIDGVRMDADVSQGPTQRGGGGASRLNDINPDDIESIEIIKGPAASTLYGTEASNGVVQIITKRGRTGKAVFDFSTRQGTNWLANPEGRAGELYGKTSTGDIIHFNLYEHEIQTGHKPIFENGYNEGYNASLSGGNDANRYYLTGSYDNDAGIVSWNWDKKFTARANVDVLPTNKLRFQASLGHIRDRVRLAQSAIDIDPFSNLVWGTPLTMDTNKRGFGFSPPDEWSSIESHANTDRTTLSVTTNFTPLSWFENRLVTGLDVDAEDNFTLYPRQPLGNLDPLGNNGLGNKSDSRASRTFYTLDYAGSAKYGLNDALRFTSSVGLQAYRSELSTITATATTFAASPITTITGGATRSATEGYLANATVGMFGQQELAWRDRLFLTAALRGDDNSSFGKQFKAAYYPKVSGSWVVSEEPWFHVPKVDNFRLRGALGAAGTQPGAFDASRLYVPVVGYQNGAGLAPGSFGNPKLRPERSREIELGFETTVLSGLADVSYSHYARKITDAIINSPIPPSLGFPGSQVVNIGRVSAWGDELALSVRPVRRRKVTWEIASQVASNGNRIEDMGGTQFLTVGGGGQAQNRVGFSVADFFLYKVRSATIDSTGKVLTAICDGGTGKSGLEQGGPDVPCAQAPRVLWGHSQPTWQFGLNNTVTLADRLTIYARMDGNGGHLQSDTEIRALHNQGSTLAVIQRNDPFLQEYRAIEADAPGTYKAGFLRLRELSASYTLAPRLAQRVGASRGSITLAGRNIAMLWTAQHGWNTSRDGEVYVDIANQHVWDPEIRAVGQLSNGYQTILPQTVSFVATLRLTF